MGIGWILALGFTGLLAYSGIMNWAKPLRWQNPENPKCGQQISSDETLRQGAVETVSS